ncbi:glycine betaine/proline transport system substrate-binding protein [Pullulanibacillus pueri]|uniref:Glycine betaine-binding protein OpuAC n=1 Tax=Pullulanibacillus pueri TaxID=1437324 RepID=A0A8J2ZZY8_9BACL|nr:glycine betaine/proline transport system substrate-binding protein [Pullulanibacillus pueri]GGH87362.1 glycine betaine-binding protein OpuAC [Pullulanibacillus pueri]
MKKLSAVLLAMMMLIGFALVGCGSSDEASGSSKSIGEQLDYTITGIDPGAGVTQAAQKSVEDYGLDKYKVQTSSESTMVASLKKAYENKEPIVITGWSPHWMFAQFDLKYLDDPKKSFGEAEDIHTIAHKGFSEKHPNLKKFFSQFKWTDDDMNAVMLKQQDNDDALAAAKEWLKDNQDKVDQWTKGVKKGNGEEIKMAYVAWSSAVASHNVVKAVLEDLGYKVTLQQLDAGPMWGAVAKGSADVTLSAWLPVTHEAYYKQYKDQVEDLGTSLEGTKLGLVVPKYMKDVNSISDLKK